jgi:hypothetical protein
MNKIKLESVWDRFAYVLKDCFEHISGCIGRENRLPYMAGEKIQIKVKSRMSELYSLAASLAGTSGVAAATQGWNHG